LFWSVKFIIRLCCARLTADCQKIKTTYRGISKFGVKWSALILPLPRHA
jgi:hypothetical protein